MTTSPDTPRPRRAKKMTDEALATRLASSLDPKMSAPAERSVTEPLPRRVAAEPPDAAPEPGPRRAPTVETPAREAVHAGTLFEASVDRFAGAVTSAQELARDAARSVADSRLQAAHTLAAFQRKLLEMIHANLNEGFEAAQKVVTAPSIGEAIKVQSSFATARVRTLTGQAAELRALSAKLAQEAQEPWAAHVVKSLERMRTGLGA